MSEKLLIETSPLETRVALLSGGRLEGFHIIPSGSALLPGTPLVGRIRSVVPSLEAAFVDIGLGQDAFLPLSKTMLGSSAEGDLVLAGLSHLGTGDKGARLSREISLPGRGLVLLIGGNGVHYSRQLAEGEPRARLAALIAGLDLDRSRFGLIVRTEAANLDDDVLRDEFADLVEEALRLIASADGATRPGALLPAGPRLALFLRGMNLSGTAIHIDSQLTGADLQEHWGQVRPDLAGALRVDVARGLMEEAGIDEAVDALLGGRIKLPSGGEIVIQETEALAAIDVNTGATTRTKGETGSKTSRAIQTNLEAAREIARVLRVANIGGLVVIDFLKMSRDGEARVLEGLQTCLAGDTSPVRIGGFSKLGLLDLSRARRGPSLFDLLTDKKRHVRLNSDALAARAVRLALREAEASPGRRIVCQMASEVHARIETLRARASGDRVGALESRIEFRPREDFRHDQIETTVEG